MTNTNHQPIEFPADRTAFLEDAFSTEEGCLSAGGLAHELGMLQTPAPDRTDRSERSSSQPDERDFDPLRVALSRFVEFSRRKRKLSVSTFADKAGVEIDEVLQIEDEDAPAPEPRVIFSIAAFLKADATKLMELAGHLKPRGSPLGEEAIRFAAWAQGSKPLSKDEEKILRAFAKVVVESDERK